MAQNVEDSIPCVPLSSSVPHRKKTSAVYAKIPSGFVTARSPVVVVLPEMLHGSCGPGKGVGAADVGAAVGKIPTSG